jgi:hypothetical protein
MIIKGYRWEERKYDELALKSIIEINKRPKINKGSTNLAEESARDLILERAENFQNLRQTQNKKINQI